MAYEYFMPCGLPWVSFLIELVESKEEFNITEDRFLDCAIEDGRDDDDFFQGLYIMSQ